MQHSNTYRVCNSEFMKRFNKLQKLHAEKVAAGKQALDEVPF